MQSAIVISKMTTTNLFIEQKMCLKTLQFLVPYPHKFITIQNFIRDAVSMVDFGKVKAYILTAAMVFYLPYYLEGY